MARITYGDLKKLEISKLWSLNPDKFKFITLEKAIKNYAHYLQCWEMTWMIHKEINPKSFYKWLKTEI